MPWLDDVHAVLLAWFPGQEMGNALVDLLSGAVEPQGRLPVTFPFRLEDTPAFEHHPWRNAVADYREGRLVGHQWYETVGREPLFPFGFGLGYGRADITDVAAPDPHTVTCTVTGGERDAVEVVQVYAHLLDRDDAPRDEPAQRLVGFAKVIAPAGSSQSVTVALDPDGYRRWDVDAAGLDVPRRVATSCASVARPATSSPASRSSDVSADRVAARARLWSPLLRPLLDTLYGDVTDTEALLAARRAHRRPTERSLVVRRCARLDIDRETDPSWFQHSSMIGYVAYADLFGGTLQGVADHLDYLSELRVSYLHLMKVLRARDGANDGGYAVLDYRDVDPALGQLDRPRAPGRPAPRARREPVPRPRHEPHCARTTSGPSGRAPARAAHRDYYLVFPDRDRAGSLRGHAARGVPGDRSRQLHLGRAAAGLGVDHVPRLPVGPELREPGRPRRDAGAS